MFYEYVLVAFLGMLSHFIKKVMEANGNNPDFSLLGYWTKHKLATVSSIVAVASALAVAHGMDQLNYIAAYTIGISGNTASDYIRNKFGPAR